MLNYLASKILLATADVAGLFSCAGSGGSSGSSGTAAAGGGLMSFLPIILIFVVLIVVMIVPQRRREKKVKEMLNAIKVGDRVRTIGGIYGTVTSLKDDVVIIQTGPDKARLVFARGAISQIDDKGAENTLNEEVISADKK